MPQARQIVPKHGVRVGLNTTGSDIPKARLVIKTTAAVDGVGVASAGTSRLYGVSMQVIVAGRPGDVQYEGRAIVEASAAIAVGAKITATTGGKAVTAGAAANVIGIAASAAAADGELIEVDIDREVSAA